MNRQETTGTGRPPRIVVTRRIRAALQECADALSMAGAGEGRKALAAALECPHVRRVLSDRALAELAATGLLVPPAKPARRSAREAAREGTTQGEGASA